MSVPPKRGRGNRNWEDVEPELILTTDILDRVAGDLDIRPRVTIQYRIQIKQGRLLDLWQYLDFLELVYDVVPQTRRYRGGWVVIKLAHTTLRSMIGIQVATWLYNMPTPYSYTIR